MQVEQDPRRSIWRRFVEGIVLVEWMLILALSGNSGAIGLEAIQHFSIVSLVFVVLADGKDTLTIDFT